MQTYVQSVDYFQADREKTNEQLNTQWTVVTGGQCMDGKHTAAHLTPK